MPFAMAKARIGTAMDGILAARQDKNGDLNMPDGWVMEDGRAVPFWWSRTGVIIKWSVFLGLMAILILYLVGGYVHAKRRIRKGMKPLRYHRFLLSRAELARVDPAYAYPQATYTNYAPGPQGYYGMQPMPPPVYDPNRPPMYFETGPPGAAKVDPAQGGAAGDFAPPPGPPPPGPPPPAAQRTQGTGSNNPFADPPRN